MVGIPVAVGISIAEPVVVGALGSMELATEFGTAAYFGMRVAPVIAGAR
mgnify:CR=1 FL=1